MVELAVRRVSTAVSRPVAGLAKTEGAAAGKFRAADMGWPGMMSIRLHELDGMYDHPSLPMAGDALQLLELQCHSKLAGRRIQRPKKGTTKADAVEDNVESTPAPRYCPLPWMLFNQCSSFFFSLANLFLCSLNFLFLCIHSHEFL